MLHNKLHGLVAHFTVAIDSHHSNPWHLIQWSFILILNCTNTLCCKSFLCTTPGDIWRIFFLSLPPSRHNRVHCHSTVEEQEVSFKESLLHIPRREFQLVRRSGPSSLFRVGFVTAGYLQSSPGNMKQTFCYVAPFYIAHEVRAIRTKIWNCCFKFWNFFAKWISSVIVQPLQSLTNSDIHNSVTINLE